MHMNTNSVSNVNYEKAVKGIKSHEQFNKMFRWII